MKLPKYQRGEPVSVKITPTRIVIAVLVVALIAACGAIAEQNAETLEVYAQDQIALHYDTTQPIPIPKGKSQIRENLIELELAQINGVQTTSFECAGLDGCDPTHPPIKSCPSIGAPIPVTDELTNPEQPLRQESQPLNSSGGNVTVGEMDPDGVYPGDGTGTYVLCIGADGAVTPAYWEGNDEVEFAPAEWVQGKGIVDIGPPSYQFTR